MISFSEPDRRIFKADHAFLLSIKLLIVALLIFLFADLSGQGVILNTALDTVTSPDNKKIVSLWRKYLKSDPEKLSNSPYWNAREKAKYKSYDLLRSEGFLSPSLYHWAKHNKNIILSITKKGNDYILKSMFYRTAGSNEIGVLATINVMAEQTKGEYYLANYLPVYTKSWHKTNHGMINYIYYPDYAFDPQKADVANDFVHKLKSTFGLSLDTITYYIARNCDEIHQMKGFDYVFTMGSLDVCGFYDADNKIVYSTSSAGESNKHELAHIINPLFPVAHPLLLAGLSAYWGGEQAHLGKSLTFHAKRINDYLSNHQELDLSKFPEFYHLDAETNPQYLIGAILCDHALKNGGVEKLKRLLTSGSTDSNIISVTSKELGIPPKGLNTFFRKRISEIAASGIQAVEPK